MLKESHCLFRSGLKACYSHFGCLFQQKRSMWIRNKQFWSQTAQHKPSVKQSPCISPLKVEVEQCVVLLKRVFLQQTSSKPTTSCCYNKVFQGVYYFFLSKCYPYESYLLYGVYFCAKEHLCPHLLPQCFTEMTETRETGFQDKDPGCMEVTVFVETS